MPAARPRLRFSKRWLLLLSASMLAGALGSATARVV
jgi:hypothetical protein